MPQHFHLWLYTQENWKAENRTVICTAVFRAALFAITKKWQHSKYPLTDKWIKKCGICIQLNIIQPLKIFEILICSYSIEKCQVKKSIHKRTVYYFINMRFPVW